ncbi:MAG: hypothetical protein U1F29_10755 [Planctomycetota bacterium]
MVSLLAALLAPSCVTPPPPIEHGGPHGVVRAFTDDEAREVSTIANEMAVEVSRVLGVEPQPFVIHVYPDDADHAAGIRVRRDGRGVVVERLIELRPGVRSAPRFLIAHELTHWNVGRSAWDRLPHYAEEGLCDFVAGVAAPDYWGERVLDLKVRAAPGLDSPLDEVFSMSSRTWEWADGAVKSSACAIGYFLVDRIGLDRLRQLCESSVALGPTDVSIEQLLEAANLDRASLMSELSSWGATADPRPFELRLKLRPSGG